MFKIECDECGRKAEVPFKPKADRPVYCSTCFSERRANRPRKTGLNFSFSEKNAWARRGKGFTGVREELPTSIFSK